MGPGHWFRLRGENWEYLIQKAITRIGREPALCDLTLDDGQLSRLHVMLLAETTGPTYSSLTLIDCQSTNGARVNGEPVTRAWLKHGDVIEIGTSRMTVIDGEPELIDVASLSRCPLFEIVEEDGVQTPRRVEPQPDRHPIDQQDLDGLGARLHDLIDTTDINQLWEIFLHHLVDWGVSPGAALVLADDHVLSSRDGAIHRTTVQAFDELGRRMIKAARDQKVPIHFILRRSPHAAIMADMGTGARSLAIPLTDRHTPTSAGVLVVTGGEAIAWLPRIRALSRAALSHARFLNTTADERKG